MNYFKNERGNAAIFLLWLLGIVAIIFILTINIVKVYIVKEHANLAVEQAALAGTAVLLEKTKKAVKDFDTKPTLDPLYILDREAQQTLDLGKSVSELIENRKNQLVGSGRAEADAYIKAANEILPVRVDRHYFLKKELKDAFGSLGSELSAAVIRVINDNDARQEDTVIELSNDHWRVEVESTVRFESISDNKYIMSFFEDIPQVGYGPTLSFLEKVYN
ncbi:hypothetical protein [Bacillus sp. B15-48]|uniref:hypothetical protein n=1 Tax=Bacillus sp. B15-48 TaxID=1548601 RepID=UPI00193F1DA0|nr:hypothetical protein [Bacillus sp. B15-48]MBM4763254.1 hypothetical protein [Bacillus sp. B15-48]